MSMLFSLRIKICYNLQDDAEPNTNYNSLTYKQIIIRQVYEEAIMKSTRVYGGKNILLIFAISLLLMAITGVTVNAATPDNTTFNKAKSVSVNYTCTDNLILQIHIIAVGLCFN